MVGLWLRFFRDLHTFCLERESEGLLAVVILRKYHSQQVSVTWVSAFAETIGNAPPNGAGFSRAGRRRCTFRILMG